MQADGHDYFSVSETGQTLVVRQQLDFDQLRHRGPTFYLLNLTATVSEDTGRYIS